MNEIKYALEVSGKKGDDYKVIPLLMAGIKSAELNKHFGDKPVGSQIQIGTGGINDTVSQIFEVLNKSLSDKRESTLLAGIENSLHDNSHRVFVRKSSHLVYSREVVVFQI